MATKSVIQKSRWSASRTDVEIPSEDIARRAYERFITRGGQHGNDIQDWLEAEKELRSQVLQRR